MLAYFPTQDQYEDDGDWSDDCDEISDIEPSIYDSYNCILELLDGLGKSKFRGKSFMNDFDYHLNVLRSCPTNDALVALLFTRLDPAIFDAIMVDEDWLGSPCFDCSEHLSENLCELGRVAGTMNRNRVLMMEENQRAAAAAKARVEQAAAAAAKAKEQEAAAAAKIKRDQDDAVAKALEQQAAVVTKALEHHAAAVAKAAAVAAAAEAGTPSHASAPPVPSCPTPLQKPVGLGAPVSPSTGSATAVTLERHSVYARRVTVDTIIEHQDVLRLDPSCITKDYATTMVDAWRRYPHLKRRDRVHMLKETVVRRDDREFLTNLLEQRPHYPPFLALLALTERKLERRVYEELKLELEQAVVNSSVLYEETYGSGWKAQERNSIARRLHIIT